MKSGITVVLMICAVLTGVGFYLVPAARATTEGQSFTGEQLSLVEAVGMALKHSPVIKIAEDEYKRALGVRTEAKGAMGPSVSISGQVIRNDKVETASIGMPGGPATTIQLGELYTKGAVATISQPLDIAGVLGAAAGAAGYQARAAAYDLEAARQELVLNVRSKYLQAILAGEQLRVASESVERLTEYLRLAKVKLETGSAPKFDVLRAETELRNAEQVLISAQNGSKLAALALENTIGVDLPDNVKLISPAVVEKPLPAVDELVEKGLKNRPEQLSADMGIEAAKKGIMVARRGLLPSLGLSFNYNWNGNTTLFQPREFTWNAVAGINIPIFDSGVTKGRIRQAEAREDQAKQAKELQNLTVKLQVEQAYSSVENAVKRLAAAMANLDLAKESLRLAQVRYESGAGEPIEVTDAQLALTQAETNLVNSRFDLFLSYAQLARATGDATLAMD